MHNSERLHLPNDTFRDRKRNRILKLKSAGVDNVGFSWSLGGKSHNFEFEKDL